MKSKGNFGFRHMFHGFTKERRAQEAGEIAADKDNQAIDESTTKAPAG